MTPEEVPIAREQAKQQASILPQWRRDSLQKALSEGPRNEAGDPCFTHAQLMEYFTPSEIAWLCNRALYQEDYQRAYHKKRQERKKLQRIAQASAPDKDKNDTVSTVKSLLAARKARAARLEREEEARLRAEAALPEPELSPADARAKELLSEAFAKKEV